MSWMDSWSRPNKSSATPPPLYLTSDDVKYCQACGRVIGARKSHKQQEIVKYCSDGCRKRRLGKTDKKIDATILALLLGEKDSGVEKIDVKSRFRKGDHRTMIYCDEIEDIVFSRQKEPSSKVEPHEDDVSDTASIASEPNDGDTDEDPSSLQGKPPNPTGPGSSEVRQAGQRRAEEREMVRRAARRAVVFGYAGDQTRDDAKDGGKPLKAGAGKQQLETEPPRRKCEAVMNGQVVEPSFAKGNWAIRWRE